MSAPYRREIRSADEQGCTMAPCRVLVADGVKLIAGPLPEIVWPAEYKIGYGAQVKYPRPPSGFGLDLLSPARRSALGRLGGLAKAKARRKVG